LNRALPIINTEGIKIRDDLAELDALKSDIPQRENCYFKIKVSLLKLSYQEMQKGG